MSDHCGECFYRPGERVGEHASPFTTLDWDFLDRNRERLAGNRRMALSIRNLDRIDSGELRELRRRADRLRSGFDA
jgi:deoxyribodipyrimidine photolyase-related protein